ncbi:hypothetical protein SADUNF_Sadunf06G0150200 [Salix dunnii]|uniref:Uncharacterized protein n=1 Tax=Salix dunnii TaxID=1413687 RepID=A0A835K4I3_9ROSI|nr:hypothetical protein SADUNF_Sadunf06G0150200 [Salix dunnii]
MQSHRSNGYSRRPKRSRRLNVKETLFRNVNAYTNHIFQSSQDIFDEEDPTSSSGPSWFRQQYSKGSKNNRTSNQGTRSCSKSSDHEFCEDQDYFDVDTLFRSTFGGSRVFYWSFINEETPRWKNSSGYSYNYERNWRYRVEEDYDSSSEFDSNQSEADFASDKLALGLSASGPLKLEDVKHAWFSLDWQLQRKSSNCAVRHINLYVR